MTLSQIDAHPDQIAEIKGFNNKYKYRFTVMHKRKLEEQCNRNSLNLLKSTTQFVMDNQQLMEVDKVEKKKMKLQEKLKEIESSKASIKMGLTSLDRLIIEQ